MYLDGHFTGAVDNDFVGCHGNRQRNDEVRHAAEHPVGSPEDRSDLRGRYCLYLLPGGGDELFVLNQPVEFHRDEGFGRIFPDDLGADGVHLEPQDQRILDHSAQLHR